MQLARLLAVQQVQEVAADGLLVAHAIDALAFVAEAIPVSHDRRECSQQAIGLVVLLGEVVLRLQVAQERAARAHHVHRVGVGGDAFQHFFQRLRQVAQLAQLGDVGVQLRLARQFAVQQQVGDFFELCVSRQFTNVITTIGQTGTRLAHGGQCGLPGYLATEPGATEYFCFGHFLSPIFFLSEKPVGASLLAKVDVTPRCIRDTT
ncbi:hypothetical protein D3C81_1576000 [compost metagenome]